MGRTILHVTAANAGRWNEYVNRYSDRNDLCCNHAFDWSWSEVLATVFGHVPVYLAVDTDGTITGVLPLFLVSSALFGRALISMPYLNAGGPLVDDDESLELLLAETERLNRAERVKYVELRAEVPLSNDERKFTVRTHKVAMRLALQGTPEEMFSKFPAKLRSQVRKPNKAGYTAQRFLGKDERAISLFYKVFSRNMRDLGTPVYPRSLFLEAGTRLSDRCAITTVSKDGMVAAAAMTIVGWKSIEVLWASSLRAQNSDSPNMLLYWEMIKEACLSGMRQFDFGRSSINTGTYRFKEQWGAMPHQLVWNYLGDPRNIPDVSPNSGRFAWQVNLWRNLPLLVANTLGARLTRHIP